MRRATKPRRLKSRRCVISIHALLAESDRLWVEQQCQKYISIHALLAESDRQRRSRQKLACYFYPRSPCGERPCIMTITICTALFLSTLSLRRATASYRQGRQKAPYFYPRSPCGERLFVRHVFADGKKSFLSTLSLRRATATAPSPPEPQRHFYPRSPCGERPRSLPYTPAHRLFLSTLSLRRATCCGFICYRRSSYFYPRSPCGERHFIVDGHRVHITNFYPRSPCGERHFLTRTPKTSYGAFLSTLSLRRATKLPKPLTDCVKISIHALLAESDGTYTLYGRVRADFYPRSPCGERR